MSAVCTRHSFEGSIIHAVQMANDGSLLMYHSASHKKMPSQTSNGGAHKKSEKEKFHSIFSTQMIASN